MAARIVDSRTTQGCLQCGYSLRGLPARDYRCPECGSRYESSTRRIPVCDPLDSGTPPLADRLRETGSRIWRNAWVILLMFLMAIVAALLKTSNPAY